MIQQIRLKDGSLTYEEFIQRITIWNIRSRLHQKFSQWHFKHALPILSKEWIQLVVNCLAYYVLKNLSFLVSNYTQELLLWHSFKMKENYSHLNGLSSNRQEFDFNIVITVKLITYFIASHIHEILIDQTLENEIYKLIILNILGVSVEDFTYNLLLKRYKNKNGTKKVRESLDISKENINLNNNLSKVGPIFNFGRRNGKKQTSLFSHAGRAYQEQNMIDEVKCLIRQSLYVKPASKPINQKYNIHNIQLKQQGKTELLRGGNKSEHHQAIYNSRHSKFTIQSNQLSNAFQLNNNIKLKDVKSFSIHCTPGKEIAHTYLKRYPIQILEPPRVSQTIKEVEPQKQVKSIKNWSTIVSNMKEEIYGRKVAFPSEVNEQKLSFKRCSPKSIQILNSGADVSEANELRQSGLNQNHQKCEKLNSIHCLHSEVNDKKSSDRSNEVDHLPNLSPRLKEGRSSIIKVKGSHANLQRSSGTVLKQNFSDLNLPSI